MADKYELEIVYQIWDNQHGERIEVGPDRDGLELTEIRYVTPDGKIGNSVTLNEAQKLLLIQALRNTLA